MENVYFIGDCHFGHKNILKYRPQFKTIEEHDNTIIENWNSTVKKSKYPVWVLGDFMMKNPKYDFKKLLSSLHGDIRIITGNHCELSNYPIKMLRRSLVAHYKCWLSHAPIHPDEMRNRLMNIHGHVHFKTIDSDKYFNACVENINYKPISLAEIFKIKGVVI